MKLKVIMLENYSHNTFVDTLKAQGIILSTLYNAHQVTTPEVDLEVLINNAKAELIYFADAISILREGLLIYTPSYGAFGITNAGIKEYNLRRSSGKLF